jgi:hypothetical protein
LIRLTLVSNALHLEAVRRLRRLGLHRNVIDLLIWEPDRMLLTPADRRLWPLRLPVSSAVMVALAALALVGLVEELRLPHLHRAGRALRLMARRARRLTLIDDGLDQYRNRPRAVDPAAFPAGTSFWLFSDAPQGRAAWCRRFECHELGPLYVRDPGAPELALGPWGTLIIDAPGLERLAAQTDRLPRPWLVLPHPVLAKRTWILAATDGERFNAHPPEQLIAQFSGLVVVGESMTLLAAIRLRPPGTRLLVALPERVDPNLLALARRLAAHDPAVEVL